jgi:hypothetical protein
MNANTVIQVLVLLCVCVCVCVDMCVCVGFVCVRLCVNRTFFGCVFQFSKSKGVLLVYLFLRTRVEKVMKEYGTEREKKGFTAVVG